MIQTMDGLVAAIATGTVLSIYIPSATNVAGGWINLNQPAATSFGQMAAPALLSAGGTAYVQATLTTGFPRWSPSANATQNTYIAQASFNFATVGSVILYDLLWAGCGANSNLLGPQAIASFPGFPVRNAGANQCEIWVGCSSATGATAQTITVQYANSTNVLQNTVATSMVASMPANRMFRVPLAGGDTGLRNVMTVTFSAGSGTPGNVWIYVMDRLTSVSSSLVNAENVYDFSKLGLPVMDANSCLLFVNQASTTSSGVILGQLAVVQG